MVIFRISLVFLFCSYSVVSKASICENVENEVQCIKIIVDDIQKTEGLYNSIATDIQKNFQRYLEFVEGNLLQCFEDKHLSNNQNYNLSLMNKNCLDYKKEYQIKKCRLSSFKYKQAQEFRVAFSKINRGKFEDALKLLKNIDEKDYSFRFSFSNSETKLSLLKQTKKREHSFTDDILNISDNTFKPSICIDFINNHPNTPFEFDRNHKEMITRTIGFIYAQCLANLPTEHFKTVITSNDKYKTENAGMFSHIFLNVFGYYPENDEKIKFALQYPYLTKNIKEQALKMIKSGGYKTSLASKLNKNDFPVFLENYNNTNDLQSRIQLTNNFLEYRNKELKPSFPNVQGLCQHPTNAKDNSTKSPEQ